MLRNIQIKPHKPVYTFYKASTNLKTGQGVVINLVDGTVGYPTTATADNIFIVDKERIPTGIAVDSDLSDYYEEFNNVVAGDFVKLHSPEGDERRATDQYVSGATIGDPMVVGTDGKWVKGTAGAKSRFLYGGIFSDNGHDLAILHIVNDPVVVA